MLQDRINQDVQHNMIQDNIAYNRRLYDIAQRSEEEDVKEMKRQRERCFFSLS